MMPFRELEVLDAFTLNGQECDKVGTDKYLIYDEQGEPESLQVADPNLMVELVDDEEMEYKEAVKSENEFFDSLLNLIDGLQKQYKRYGGEKLTIKNLRQFAKDRLAMPEDD